MTVPHIMLITVALATLVGMVLLYRSRASFPPLPPWAWRNIIALIALYASVAGAAIITALVWMIIDNLGADADRLIAELVRDPKAARAEIGDALKTIYQSIANNLLALTLGLLAILIGFGFAITARRFQGEFLGGKFNMSGGDDEPTPGQAAQQVANAAEKEADQIQQSTTGEKP
jgi:hypothetical protein